MKVAVMWSGGKDSTLAHYRALEGGHEICAIVTFSFDGMLLKGHPCKLLPLQSEALGVRHYTFNANKPYIPAYREALRGLIEKEEIGGLVTGDISLECGRKWLEEVCEPLPVKLLMPLWNMPPGKILGELVSKKFSPMITCVEKPLLGEEWLGRIVDKGAMAELEDYCAERGIDACGENGEFHTMMLDAPTFNRRIVIEEFGIWEKDNKYAFIEPKKFFLEDKAIA